MRFYKGYIPFTDWTIHCYELGSNFPFQFSWAKAKKVYLNFLICILVKFQIFVPNRDYFLYRIFFEGHYMLEVDI